MNKKVSITPKPLDRKPDPDAWVEQRALPEPEKKPTKRLTIEIDAELHRRVKTICAREGRIMAEEVRAFLEQSFPPERAQT